jgi:hypothetical protein
MISLSPPPADAVCCWPAGESEVLPPFVVDALEAVDEAEEEFRSLLVLLGWDLLVASAKKKPRIPDYSKSQKKRVIPYHFAKSMAPWVGNVKSGIIVGQITSKNVKK